MQIQYLTAKSRTSVTSFFLFHYNTQSYPVASNKRWYVDFSLSLFDYGRLLIYTSCMFDSPICKISLYITGEVLEKNNNIIILNIIAVYLIKNFTCERNNKVQLYPLQESICSSNSIDVNACYLISASLCQSMWFIPVTCSIRQALLKLRELRG